MTQTPETPGQKLDRYLRRAKMQQKELAAQLGVEPSYVSRMVNDRVGWVYGRYFGQIATLLRLKDDEIKELNPAAVIEITSPEPRVSRSAALSAGAMGYRGPKPERAIPEGLEEAARLFGHLPAFAGLSKPAWQTFLREIPRKKTPVTAEEWKDEYLQLKAMGYGPEED